MIAKSARIPLALMLVWAGGVVAWNLVGLSRIESGQPPIGPTASRGAAGVGVLLALVLLFGAVRSRMLLILGSAAVALLGGLAVYGAISGEPSQWPTPGWRWAGALLNAIGLVGAGILLGRQLQRA